MACSTLLLQLPLNTPTRPTKTTNYNIHTPHQPLDQQDEPLDVAGTAAAFEALTADVNAHAAAAGRPPKSPDEVAMGFIRVANEAMCRPIRALTQMKGHDAAAHVLACFGGAGGQHACAIAAALGMRTIFVHRYAGVLSAVGIHLADIVQEAQEPAAATLGGGGSADGGGGGGGGRAEGEGGSGGGEDADAATLRQLAARLDALAAQAVARLEAQGFAREQINVERFLNLRCARRGPRSLTLGGREGLL